MTKARWVRLVAGLFVLSLVVAACSSDDNGGGTTDTTGGATGTTAETGSSGGGATITIAGFAFDPDTITVSGPTEVTVTNDDSTTHTFTLDDGSVDETVEPGATETVTVDVSASTGFHCNIHPQMTGQIEVS
ncbi:MAG TPA: cupredoxin domain-containing protein [Actinomycetota bacterium]|jgi:plastocyanin